MVVHGGPQARTAGLRYVLAVGIDYATEPSLRLGYARSDAEQVARFYRDQPDTEVVLMTETAQEESLRPTCQRIREQVVKLRDRKGPDDQIIFYFSGHGYGRGDEQFLVPMGVDLDAPDADSVDLSFVAKQFSLSNAQQRVLIVDACRNTFDVTADLKAFQAVAAPDNTYVFQSCGEEQRSFEFPRGEYPETYTKSGLPDGVDGAGLFTLCLLDGLRGRADLEHDGYVNAAELWQYCAVHTQDLAESLGATTQGRVQSARVRLAGDTPPVLAQVRGTKPAPHQQEQPEWAPPPEPRADGFSSDLSLAAHPPPPEIALDLSARGAVVNTTDGSILVPIPAGGFVAGSEDVPFTVQGRTVPARDMGGRVFRVHMPLYYMGAHEVTNAQYERFVKATGYAPSPTSGAPDHPVLGISLVDAWTYCVWAGLEVPTELQWEKAARGTDGRIYPWGNEWDSLKCRNAANCGAGETSSVWSYPDGASPHGLLGMSGNAWEWCSDPYQADAYDRYARGDMMVPTPTDREFGPYVIRGGSYLSTAEEGGLMAVFRCAHRSDGDMAQQGFRVAHYFW